MKIQTIIYPLCMAALLGSCHIYKPYSRPEVDTQGLYRDPVSVNDTLVSDTVNMANLPWEKVFTDPQLQVLIRLGLERNTDLQTAMLQVKEAQASLMTSRLSYLPSLTLAPQGGVSSFDRMKGSWSWSLPVSASWELDLFGKILNTKRAAKAALLRSEAYRQAVQTQVVAAIANYYYTLLMLDKQLQITEETAVLWGENVETMKAMKEAAMVNEAGVVQSEANYYMVLASISDLKNQIRETENALSLLLRQAPQKIERGKLEDQQLPTILHTGVPVQLLSNRPDVKAAEMALAGTYYNANEARAAFYPGLNMTATAGWTNGSGITVSNPGQFMFQALASLAQPIFNNGKLMANLKVSKAEEKIAQMNYQQAILQAGKEVSDALHLYDATNKMLVQDKEQIAQLEKAVEYTKALFQSAESTYLEILSAQQSLLSAQLTEVSDNVQRMQAVINLYSAVGGGRE